ncbi:hypothetical protein HPP92_020390 [Vanilla planifolia]|uniref:Transmembrane protein 53 n=1 Tax=Vanilla planifolia TaxID=51239 RepID=A0A835PY06_VANPL|nr:hypothetical protein HPP92_020390 [Vanilla planifolia]
MAFFSGNFQRPLSAMAAVAFAAASSDFIPDRFVGHKSSETNSPPVPSSSMLIDSSSSGISSMSSARPAMRSTICLPEGSIFSSPSFATPTALLNLYQYAKLAEPLRNHEIDPKVTYSSSDILYRWHLPNPNADGRLGNLNCSSAKSRTVVVLLGWLGARQKHLNRYAEWYTSRGFHVVTFTFPMSEIVSYKAGGKAEKDLELLADHLADWVSEETGKNLVFHTFSNTGWITYGVILEKLQKQNPSVLGNIKGCIVDSAPVAAPDPQVWASGFSAAFLKKQSVATKGVPNSNASETGAAMTDNYLEQPKPAMVEAALLTVLEKFFEVVLNLPAISRRLSDVFDLLSMKQPKCPQLYIYSSADRVIPAKNVESFVEEQRRAGYEVRSCNFVSSPHVDHFRNHETLYSSQLTSFLEDCVLARCKASS